MFEYMQDTGILQYSLVHAANAYSGSLWNVEDSTEALNTVAHSIENIIVHNLRGIKDDKEIINTQLHLNERLHAVVFFNTLRSHGITSDAANTYYGSISNNWPLTDFKFYVELNYRRQWSEYFIKCASQLPSEILLTVIKNILEVPFSKHLKYYSWHLLLQPIILKLLKLPAYDKAECRFDFNFATEISTLERINEEKGEAANISDSIYNEKENKIASFEHAFNILYDFICADVKESNDINVIKILLHALKILLKYKESFSHCMLRKIFQLVGDCLHLNDNVEALKTALNKYTCKIVSHTYATKEFSISESYLSFIIDYYYSILSPEEVLNLKNELGCLEYSDFFLVILRDICPFTKDYFYLRNDKHLELLFKIITLRFEEASYAAKLLLANSILLQKDCTLKILEENSDVIDVMNVYPLILKSVLTIESQEVKVRLLKLFYKILCVNPLQNYNEVLKYILCSYGFTNKFQLPDFDCQLSLFVRKTSAVKEVQSILPTLFVQSPKVTLECVIEEVLDQGLDGKPLIQALKFVPEACIYCETCEDIPPLIKILKDYLDNDALEAYESKNFATLFEFLMETHLETYMLPVDMLIKLCIIPNLMCSDRIELILGCLNVIVQKLVAKEVNFKQKYLACEETVEIPVNREFDLSGETLKSVISVLAQIINTCIESGSGRMKELAISVLSSLKSYEMYTNILNDDDKEDLFKSFTSFNEVIWVYGKECLPNDLALKNQSSLWIWCCENKDLTIFEEKLADQITYPELLNTLVELLPHLTSEEWKFSITLADACFKKFSLGSIIEWSDMPFLLVEDEQHLYAVISCFITSLHFTLPKRTSESLFSITCFCNNIKTLFKGRTLTLQMILTIFLELCYLINCISPSLISAFSSVLFELKEHLLLCANNSSQKEGEKLMSHAMKCLPDSSEKNELLQKIKIFV